MDKEVLLKVEELEQYFKLGKKVLKAVDGISFEIYKGEVFGLVGESGCGKTTTGRAIIRLYDITGGSIYFRGTRIAAGVRKYKQKIKEAYYLQTKEINELKKNILDNYERRQLIKDKYERIINENKALIKLAKYDHKNVNQQYVLEAIKKLNDYYMPLINNEVDLGKKEQLKKELNKSIKLAKNDRIMNKIQMIFQDPIASLNPRMTVRDIIGEGLTIRGIKDEKAIDEQVYKILGLVGLVPEHATRYPHEFSGGQRQRIGIARALILNPELIIADEPISALDVSVQAQVINLLQELSEKMGLTTLFIAHDLAVVKYYANRIAVMYYGKIVELASTEELFENPLHPYTKSLLSSIPLPDPFFEKKRKRITYNPLVDHEKSDDEAIMREIKPGHFVYCNLAEYEKYQKELSHLG